MKESESVEQFLQSYPPRRGIMTHRGLRSSLIIAVSAYPAWLAMSALHEAGHVLHALASGGRVDRVHFPLAGFSRTDLAHNPHPLLVAWGGPAWGCLIPLALLAV